MKIIKLLVLAVVIVVVVAVAVVAVGAFSVFNNLRGEPEPLPPEIIAQGQAVERKIKEAVTDNSAFYLELTDEELSSLLLFRAGSVSGIRDIGVSINAGALELKGSLGGPFAPFSASVDLGFENGLIDLGLNDVSLGFLPIPGAVRKELQRLIDQGLDINAVLSESGAAQIQRFDMQPGRVVIVGVQKGGTSVSAATIDT